MLSKISCQSLIFLSLITAIPWACRTPDGGDDSDALLAAAERDFRNYSGSIVCKPGTVLTPRNVEELQIAVRVARTQKRNLRVVSISQPRSYSPVICPEDGGLILNLEKFDRLLSVDPGTQTAIVEPGILINELQDQLDRQGFTFPVTPDFNGITVAGGMATGAHHSSLRIASDIGSWVEEVKLVDSAGELRTLTGADLDLIRVNLGLTGAIYQLKLKIVPQTKLRYGLEKFKDDKIDRELESLVRAHDYARIMWFPSQKTFVLDYLDHVPTSTAGESYNNLWSSTPNISWLGDIPVATLNSSQLTQCTAELARVRTFGGGFKVVNSDGKNPVGWSHKMLAGTCEPGKCSWDYGLKTRTVEVAFALNRAKEWIADVKRIIAARKACFPVLGLYLRFSAQSKAALGQAYGTDTIAFEIHIPQTSKPFLEPSSDVYDEIVQMTLAKYRGRPHWGKNSLPYFLNLGTEQFPQWNAFESLRARLDADNIFMSPFWSKIREQAPVENTPACAVSRDCICKEDSDCGEKSRCEPGVVFTAARVCRP